MRKLKAIIKLIRLPNCILSGLGVIVGSFLARYFNALPLILGFFVGFLITGYSMIINDYFDLEVDKINAPDRPLVSGKISTSEAKLLAALFLVIGLLLSAMINPYAFAIALIFSLISYFYSKSLKRYGLIGNFAVALSMAIPFIYGAVIAYSFEPLPYLLASIAFFAGTSREIIKGIADVEGDKVRNINTLAISKGHSYASKVAFIFMLAAVLLSYIPCFYFKAWPLYLVLISLVDYYMLKNALDVLKTPSPEKAINVKNKILILMFSALLVFILTEAVGYVA